MTVGQDLPFSYMRTILKSCVLTGAARIGEDVATFTQSARSSQLIRCTIEALSTVGYQQTTVAEVARRAGVSKGVVTYHFPAHDDLIWAVVAEVFKSVAEEVGDRLGSAMPTGSLPPTSALGLTTTARTGSTCQQSPRFGATSVMLKAVPTSTPAHSDRSGP